MQADRPFSTHGAAEPARGQRGYRSAAVAFHMFRKSGGPSSHVTAAASHVTAASPSALSPGRRLVCRPAPAAAGRASPRRTPTPARPHVPRTQRTRLTCYRAVSGAPGPSLRGPHCRRVRAARPAPGRTPVREVLSALPPASPCTMSAGLPAALSSPLLRQAPASVSPLSRAILPSRRARLTVRTIGIGDVRQACSLRAMCRATGSEAMR